MATYAERKADEAKWEDFAARLGVTVDDIRERTGDCIVLGGGKAPTVKASIPRWLRDRILTMTTWREQDKPALKEVSNG